MSMLMSANTTNRQSRNDWQKMDQLIKQKGLQGKKGAIGFMDLLPEEEKYGYQIEQEQKAVNCILYRPLDMAMMDQAR